MGWNNSALREAIKRFGDRIFLITLNNGKGIFVNYPSKEGVKLKDISMENIGGIDVIRIKHRSSKQDQYYEWSNYMTTEFIESIEVMEEPYAELRVDPFLLN